MRVQGLHLYPLIKCLLKDLQFSRRTQHEVLSRFSCEGLPVITKLLPGITKHLLWCLEVGSWQNPQSIWGPSNLPSLRLRGSEFGRLPLIGFDEIRFVLSGEDAEFHLWRLRQLCEYLYKLALPFTEQQLAKAECDFLQIESKLGQLKVDPLEMRAIRHTMFKLFPELASLSFDELLATVDTPGSFSGVSGDLPLRLQKDFHDGFYPTDRRPFAGFYRSRLTDLCSQTPNVSTCGERHPRGPHDTEFLQTRPTQWWCGDRLCLHGIRGRNWNGAPIRLSSPLRVGVDRVYSKALRLRLDPVRVGFRGYTRHSELLFVPKDSRGPRTIVREPFDSLRFQMGFHHRIRRYLEYRSLGRIQFTDQSIFQDLARRASSGEFPLSTLDLKSASDSLSSRVVFGLLRGTGLATHIAKFRTSECRLPGGQKIQLNKLAGMGSGYTFPLMALVIYCTIVNELGIKYSSNVWVYGDDIIVPSWGYERACNALARVGLQVNVNKSYCRSAFRESCGGDYLNGIDVTPSRLSLTFANIRSVGNTLYPGSSAPDVDSFLYKLERHCQEIPWALNTCAYLYGYIEAHLGPLPIKEKGSPVLGRVGLIADYDDKSTYVARPLVYKLPQRSLNRAFSDFSRNNEVIKRQSSLEDRIEWMFGNPTSPLDAESHRYKIRLERVTVPQDRKSVV